MFNEKRFADYIVESTLFWVFVLSALGAFLFVAKFFSKFVAKFFSKLGLV